MGQQKQNFPKVVAIIYVEISSAVAGASGSDYRLSCLPPSPPSGVSRDVRHGSLSLNAKDLTWGLQTGLSRGHRKAELGNGRLFFFFLLFFLHILQAAIGTSLFSLSVVWFGF